MYLFYLFYASFIHVYEYMEIKSIKNEFFEPIFALCKNNDNIKIKRYLYSQI